MKPTNSLRTLKPAPTNEMSIINQVAMPTIKEVTPGHERFFCALAPGVGAVGVELKGSLPGWPEYALRSHDGGVGGGEETLGVPHERVCEAGLFDVGSEWRTSVGADLSVLLPVFGGGESSRVEAIGSDAPPTSVAPSSRQNLSESSI